METFAAYLLGFQFSDFVPLSNIFKFVGQDCPLFKGHLVALHRVKGGWFQADPVDLSSPLCTATYLHGCSPGMSGEFANWLHNPCHLPFCFPPHDVGPDVVVVLLLDDGTFLWVVGQVKHHTTECLSSTFSSKALATMSPREFLMQNRMQEVSIHTFCMQSTPDGNSQKGGKVTTIVDKHLHETILCQLDWLDKCTKMAGTHSVLHVLIFHPAIPNLWAKDIKDDGNHPVAVVAFEALNKSHATQQILDSLSHNILIKRQLSRRKMEQLHKQSHLR
jgi:hypothetical protein